MMAAPFHPKKCCCGGETCELVLGSGSPGDEGYLPDLTCAKVTGITVNLSGIALRTVSQQNASGTLNVGAFFVRPVDFDRSTLSGSYCCFQSTDNAPTFGCELFFVSTEPCAWATQRAVDGDGNPTFHGPVPIYVGVLFTRGDDGAVEASISFNVLRGSSIDVGYVAHLFKTIYSPLSGGTTETLVTWPWGCNLVGYTIQNAIPADHADVGSGGDDRPVLGYGGSVEITGLCTTTYCGSCAASSLAVTIDRPGRPANPSEGDPGTPDLLITCVLTRGLGDVCSYSGSEMLPDGVTAIFSLSWNGQDWSVGFAPSDVTEYPGWAGFRHCGADGSFEPTGSYAPAIDAYGYGGPVGTIEVSA